MRNPCQGIVRLGSGIGILDSEEGIDILGLFCVFFIGGEYLEDWKSSEGEAAEWQ